MAKQNFSVAYFFGAGISSLLGFATTYDYHEKHTKNLTGINSALMQSCDFSNLEDILEFLYSIQPPEGTNVTAIKRRVQKLEKATFSLSEQPIPAGQKLNLLHGFWSLRKVDEIFSESSKKFIEALKEAKIELENEILSAYSWSSKIKKMSETIFDAIYEPLINFVVKINKDKIVKIFTTNYDLCIENFCKKYTKYKISTGFQDFFTGKFLSDGEKKIFLYKLHGSLTWRWDEKGEVIQSSDELSSGEENEKRKNLVVFPSRDPKAGYQDKPFTSLFQLFVKSLSELNVLIVIGCSFRDTIFRNEILDHVDTKDLTVIVISKKLPFESSLINEFKMQKIELESTIIENSSISPAKSFIVYTNEPEAKKIWIDFPVDPTSPSFPEDSKQGRVIWLPARISKENAKLTVKLLTRIVSFCKKLRFHNKHRESVSFKNKGKLQNRIFLSYFVKRK